jgi:hypothetical protein
MCMAGGKRLSVRRVRRCTDAPRRCGKGQPCLPTVSLTVDPPHPASDVVESQVITRPRSPHRRWFRVAVCMQHTFVVRPTFLIHQDMHRAQAP